MEWEAWCEAYPVREVGEDELALLALTSSNEGAFPTRREAEARKDWMEITYECGGFEIVKCGELFWILG
jgi:hypothetical protein